jgi:aldose 1-epimerase
MVAPSGEQHVVAGGGYAAVVTECGASLRLLEHEGRPLVLGWDEREQTSSGRGQLLAPWPNRIRGGRYSFAGRDLQLPISEPKLGNASHGLVRWASWSLEERTEQSVVLALRLMSQPGYPWTLDLRARYDLSAAGVTVTFTATNLSDTPAPYAVGAHPYLVAGPGPLDGWELTLPARTRLQVDEQLIPVGRQDVTGSELDFREPRPLRSTSLDTTFTDLVRDAEDRVEVALRDASAGTGVALWMDAAHRWLQVFTGDALPTRPRASLAVEPLTAPPDAFNSGEDVVVLAAAGAEGDRHSASWGIRAL